MSSKIAKKNSEQLKIMTEGGTRLAKVKHNLKKAVKAGVSAEDIEKLAVKLIKKTGGKPSFMMVPGYSWATCVNVNEGVVHGIPKKEVVFKKGDVVSVDVGLYYKGMHTDTSFSVGIDVDKEIKEFLSVGENTLKRAISKARNGNRIYDISKAMQDGIELKGYNVIRALVGHGIGSKLHEEPHIPCYVSGKRETSPKIPLGATLAIEIMYAMGDYDLQVDSDEWTILTRDGKISALFEETVAVDSNKVRVLTA